MPRHVLDVTRGNPLFVFLLLSWFSQTLAPFSRPIPGRRLWFVCGASHWAGVFIAAAAETKLSRLPVRKMENFRVEFQSNGVLSFPTQVATIVAA